MWLASTVSAAVGLIKAVNALPCPLQVIKFSYRLLPASSAFSVEFPEPRRLSPGMSATIKVSAC